MEETRIPPRARVSRYLPLFKEINKLRQGVAFPVLWVECVSQKVTVHLLRAAQPHPLLPGFS